MGFVHLPPTQAKNNVCFIQKELSIAWMYADTETRLRKQRDCIKNTFTGDRFAQQYNLAIGAESYQMISIINCAKSQ